MQGTKEIEGILRHELDNWIRWGRRRDWKPAGFRVPLGFLYKSTDVHDEARSIRLPCDEIGAAAFERIIISLPEQYRLAFVVHHLEKAAIAGRICILRGANDGARLLGVQKSRYYQILNHAHVIVLREVQHLSGEDDDE